MQDSKRNVEDSKINVHNTHVLPALSIKRLIRATDTVLRYQVFRCTTLNYRFRVLCRTLPYNLSLAVGTRHKNTNAPVTYIKLIDNRIPSKTPLRNKIFKADLHSTDRIHQIASKDLRGKGKPNRNVKRKDWRNDHGNEPISNNRSRRSHCSERKRRNTSRTYTRAAQ